MTTWGSWEGPSGTRFRVGIDLSISGTTITARYYLDSEGGVNDGQKLVMGYSITGSVSYTASQPYGGGTQLIATRSITSSRGVQRRFSARIEGIYNGASPRVDAYATVPAAPPSAPGTPSASTVTSSSTTITWSAPSSTNGASIERYQIQRADNSSFTSGTAAATTTSRSYTNSSLSPNRTYYWRVRAENSAGWSSWSNGRGITTPPAIPSAPTGVTITRGTDTSQTLAWARTATTAAPYDSQQIERKDTNSDVWARIATVSGTATSYTDNTTVSSRRYDYRVRAVNSGGASAYSPVVGISTTPAAPSNVQAVKSGTSITVSWTETTSQWGIYAHVIEDNPGGTGWVVIATVGDQTSWVHSNPNSSVTHQYRVSTRVYLTTTSAGNYLTSAPSAPSNLVQLLAPPLAPSLISPTGVQDRDETITLAWKHNPVDTTAQEAYELKYRINTGTWVTHTGTTAQTRTITAPAESGTLEWQVRTKGEHATYGPWSAVWGFNLASRPNAVILTPANNAPLPASRVTLEWSYNNNDTASQTQWETQLLRGQDLIEARNGSNNETQLTLTTALADRTEYTVRLRVRASSGMWSVWETASFTTNFPQPVTVEPIPVWDQETGTVSLTFTEPPQPVLYAWAGAEDASTSTMTTDAGTLTNLAMNPGFELPASGGHVLVWRNDCPNPLMDDAGTVSGWLRRAIVSSDNPVWAGDRLAVNVTSDAGGVYCSIGSQVGTVHATVKAQTPAGARPELHIYNETDNAWFSPAVLGDYSGEEQTLTGVWSVPAAKVLRIYVRLAGTLGTLTVREVTTDPRGIAYSGGQTPDPDLTAAWGGTANNSPTTLTAPRPAYVIAASSEQGQNYQTSDGVSGRALRFACYNSNAAGIPLAQTGSATTGTLYTAVMWVRSNHPVTVTPRVKAVSVPGHEVTLTPNQWVLVRTIVTAGGGGDNQTGLVLHLGAGHRLGTNVDVDDFTLVEGSHPDLMPFHGGYQSTTAIDTITVQRRINGGEWVTLAEDVQPDGAVLDQLPTVAGVNTYRAVSKTALPTSAEGESVDFQIREPGWVYVNHGPGFGDLFRFYGNVKLSGSTGRDKVLHQFVGRQRPVAFFGESVSQSVNVAGRLTPDSSSLYDVEDAVTSAEIVCLRDPKGRRLFGVLGELSHTWEAPTLCAISFEVTEVDYDE